MRILQFNILNGCQGDPDRLSSLGDWLAHQAFDVVGLNELNGWNIPPGIARRASRWGYQHSVLFETQVSRHFVGAISRHPIETIARIEEGFHHGVLVLNITGLHVVITHLTPLDANDRDREAALLADVIGHLDGPAILMGDLNTLSPNDRAWHESAGLAGTLRHDPLLTRKFLDARMEIDYRPMRRLLDAGLTDLVHDPIATVPTSSNVDRAHAVPMRLDYILGNGDFLASRAPRATVLKESPLPCLSDHFPVVCEWNDAATPPVTS